MSATLTTVTLPPAEVAGFRFAGRADPVIEVVAPESDERDQGDRVVAHEVDRIDEDWLITQPSQTTPFYRLRPARLWPRPLPGVRVDVVRGLDPTRGGPRHPPARLQGGPQPSPRRRTWWRRSAPQARRPSPATLRTDVTRTPLPAPGAVLAERRG